jgi:hypothetical protein
MGEGVRCGLHARQPRGGAGIIVIRRADRVLAGDDQLLSVVHLRFEDPPGRARAPREAGPRTVSRGATGTLPRGIGRQFRGSGVSRAQRVSRNLDARDP